MVEAACEGFFVNCLYQELTGAARPCPPGAVTNPNSQILRLRRAVNDELFLKQSIFVTPIMGPDLALITMDFPRRNIHLSFTVIDKSHDL